MKKIAVLLIMMLSTLGAMAQKDVTKFLGIPVDGTKQEMISRLKEKGFTYDSELEFLKGEYNGRGVVVAIATNNGKVWRIFLNDDIGVGEAAIRGRYNELCRQFDANPRYVREYDDDYGDYYLGEDEDISYQITVKAKQYEASYCQLPTGDIENMSEEEFVEIAGNKKVWFTISEYEGWYYISMFYDNLYNKAHGEDL